MYRIKYHEPTKRQRKILDLVSRALLDRFDYLSNEKNRMHRSPWVSLHRAAEITEDRAVKAVLIQIRYWLKCGGDELGEAEENENWLIDRFQYHNKTGLGYFNHDSHFQQASKRLPNGDILVPDYYEKLLENVM